MKPVSQYLPENINQVEVQVLDILMVAGYLVKEEITSVNFALLVDMFAKVKKIEE